jgi:DNA mismatch repair protein MutL
MAKINILPAKVYNRIAAGEVVDRPYSVVKELIENSIDAGATEIEIYIENGGKQLIRVVDNGCGIAREDLPSAFLPHATSKIAVAEDLEKILTLGFRGEAVASIASISKMTITSKTAEGKCYSLTCDGGEIGQITEAAGEKGTDVCVEMLFFNAPVRLKFLKTDKGEEADITNYISRFILNRSDIAFTYYVNGKKVLQSFGGGDEEAMVSVYGAATLRECYRIDAEKHGIRIRGYIGNQHFYKANKSYQSVFLNGRYIVNATVSAAISNAYNSYLMKRQYPFYVLHVEVPPEIVDVNVHPNKADVRFVDNQIIYGCIYSVVSAILDGQTKALEYIVPDQNAAVQEEKASGIEQKAEAVSVQAPAGETPKAGDNFGFGMSYEKAKKTLEEASPQFLAKKQGITLPFEEVSKLVEHSQKPSGFIPASKIGPYIPEDKVQKRKLAKEREEGKNALLARFPELEFQRNLFEFHADKQREYMLEQAKKSPIFLENKKMLEEFEWQYKQSRIDISTCTYAGKLFNTYLLYERCDEFYIIDQHAAHERLIFDRLKEQMKTRAILLQPLLVPFVLEVNAFEKAFMVEHLEDIRSMGFHIEEIEENKYEISSVPLDLQYIDLSKFFAEVLSNIETYKSIKLVDLLQDRLAREACKAAIKGGMDLTKEEVSALFKLMNGDLGLKCPHGRPVVVTMKKADLEKMFKRIL